MESTIVRVRKMVLNLQDGNVGAVPKDIVNEVANRCPGSHGVC